MFSRRTSWDLTTNRLAAAIDDRRRSGKPVLDLTISNPTVAGIPYPAEEIASALGGVGRCAGAGDATGRQTDPGRGPHVHLPDPRGEPAAREAVAASYAARGVAVDPERIILTASTSEAYAWLFKLLCDPGDVVLVPRPSYPLFEFLATLDSVHVASYPLRYEGRWEIDHGALTAQLDLPGAADFPEDGATPKARGPRAIVIVNPNNPTGSYVSRPDLDRLAALAAGRALALISDEVFSTYPLAPPRDAVPTLLGSDEVPVFVLDGLSKSAGMPGMKLGWIVVCGPPAFREQALARLEMIADTYLSVGSPVQRALPRLLEIGRGIHDSIARRTAANLAALEKAVATRPAVELLGVEAGWTAVLRVPATRSEEDWCVGLASEDGVLVQPGWFYDFDREAHLVLSLLAPENELREGVARILTRAG